jgi:flavodoxin
MKTLIAYFSWSGNTEKIAKQLSVKTGGEMYRIERRNPYSKDYNTCAYVEAKEEIDKKIRPEIKYPLPDLQKYDKVILAFPIWWYTSPMPVWTFLESYPDLKGKTIYIFANSYTDDPKYFTTSIADAKASAPTADIQPGLFNGEIKRLDQWLKKNGF